MEIHNRRELADKVLACLLDALKNINADKDASASVGSYQNGREQGHSLFVTNYSGTKFKSLWVGFAEHRISDDIVVYFDDNDPMQSITNSMYDNSYHFGCDEVDGAVNFIVSIVDRVVVQGGKKKTHKKKDNNA